MSKSKPKEKSCDVEFMFLVTFFLSWTRIMYITNLQEYFELKSLTEKNETKRNLNMFEKSTNYRNCSQWMYL